MPRGNERISSNVERVVKRGACTLSKRSKHRNIYRVSSKERSSSVLGMRNLEKRCTVLFFTLDHDSWKLLVPMYVFMQGPDGRNQSGSGADSNLDFLETLKQVNSSPERPGSTESSTASSSSDSSVLAKSRNRNKMTKSVKSFSGTSQASTVLNTTSGTDSDGLDVFALDESINNISEVEKLVKKSSRKKRKKKGKQYKTSGQRKALALPQCKEICNAPVSENSDPDSPDEHISQIMLEKVNPYGLPVHDTEDDNSAEISIDCRNKSSTPVTCTSFNNEMPNSELLASLPWEFSGENPNSVQSGRCEGLNQASSSCSTTSTEIILSTSPGQSSNDLAKQNDTCETSSSISDDQVSCSEANSFLDKLKINTLGNCSDLENCDNTAKQSPVRYEYGCNSSEVGLSFNLMGRDAPFQSIPFQSITEPWDKSSETSSFCSMDYPDWSNYVLDADCTNEIVQSSSEAFSSNDFHLVFNKRGRLGRKPSFNSNSLHNQGGTDNNHQRNGTKGCICGSRNDIVCQNIDISSTDSDVWGRHKVEGRKQNVSGTLCRCRCSDEKVVETTVKDAIQSASNDVNSTDLLNATNGRLSHNCFEKLKRKSSSALNQESEGFMKELQNNKISMTRESKVHIQKARVEISPQVINHKQIGSQSTYLGTTELRSADIMLSNMLCQHESLQDKQINSFEAQNELSSLPTESDLMEKSYIKLHTNDDDHVDNQNMKVETEGMHSDNSRPDNTSGPASLKCSVVGQKNSVLFDKECSDVSIVNDPTPDRLHSGKIVLELPISNSHHSVPSSNVGLPCLSSHSEGAESTFSPPLEVDGLTHRFKSHPFPVQNFSGVVARVSRSLISFDIDICRIVQAVAESCKLLTESEAFRLMTGRPLAEFERFLHAAAPIISQSIRSCKTCSQDQIIGDALCIHQVPRISLRDLWQWYEKPGSYGLEVKVDDHYNSKRSHNGCSQFRAYFVPYLSAVQLFARSSSSVCFNNSVSNSDTKEFCKEDTTSKSSRSLESLPIFSVLLPQPHKVVSSDKDNTYCQTINSSNVTDEELLFKYFEADHPPIRKPLHEKIKQLVRGDKSSKSKIFGDPLKLESLNLHDLHPASWYSVAWYPIYRIPDGNFHAAFLTYHSLGRFVRRSTSPNLIGDITQIVSPVVGMRSYNAKGECWFPQRGFSSSKVQMGKVTSPNPSETLNERLRTLENVASVMATATVREGNKKSVNVHPDYEFFLARRR